MPERIALARNISLDFDVNSKYPREKDWHPDLPQPEVSTVINEVESCFPAGLYAQQHTVEQLQQKAVREHPLGQMGLVSLQCGNLLLVSRSLGADLDQ